MIRAGVIGYGYWGPNVARNFSEVLSSELHTICDLRPDRLEHAAKLHPLAKITRDYREVLSDPEIDAVAIVTPLSSHYSLAMEALRAGKHVLAGKPLASSSEEVKKLIEEAQKRQLVLMVDHTYVYSDAVRQIKKMVDSGELGEIYYYDSVRINLGMFRRDTNVLWDLAAHDLAIMDFIFGARPHGISALGISHVPGESENLAYVTCFYENNKVGHIHVNWLAPVKVRSVMIGGDKKMLVYDDLETHEKIKVYDKGVTMSDERGVREMMGYRTGDVRIPKIDTVEPLRQELEHFISCIQNGSVPLTDGRAGLRVVQVLEAAAHSMKNGGNVVELAGKRLDGFNPEAILFP